MAGKKVAAPTLPLPIYRGSPEDKREQLIACYREGDAATNTAPWENCTRCELGDRSLFGSGSSSADIMIIAEAPNRDDFKNDTMMSGSAGNMLNNILASTAVDPEVREWWVQRAKRGMSETQFQEKVYEWRERNFFITDLVGCQPEDDRAPLKTEIAACSERVRNIIYTVDPIMIIGLGKNVAEALVGKALKADRTRGYLFDVDVQGRFGPVRYPLVSTFPMGHLLRKADWRSQDGDWSHTLKDFLKALQIADSIRQNHYGTPIPERFVQ